MDNHMFWLRQTFALIPTFSRQSLWLWRTTGAVGSKNDRFAPATGENRAAFIQKGTRLTIKQQKRELIQWRPGRGFVAWEPPAMDWASEIEPSWIDEELAEDPESTNVRLERPKLVTLLDKKGRETIPPQYGLWPFHRSTRNGLAPYTGVPINAASVFR